MKKRKSSKWQWFSVKVIFENIISGEPEPNTIDKNYNNCFRNFDESIVMVKAQSFDHAYKIAEKKAKEMEMDYTNPYGESVNCKFVQAIDCYLIGDEKLSCGIEVYWRHLRTPKDTDTEDFLNMYYPDDDKSGIFYNSILLNKEF